jgi:hypothetical protein
VCQCARSLAGTAIIISATYGGFAAMHMSYSYALSERFISNKREESLLWKLDVGASIATPSLNETDTPKAEAHYGTSQKTASGSSNTVLSQAVNSATVQTIIGVPSMPPRSIKYCAGCPRS